MSMIQTVVTAIWGAITFVFLVKEAISLEFAYIGMCLMLVAGLLHKDE